MQTIDSLANHLLIAMPNLDDAFFEKSVVYICEHSEHGALGIMLSTELEADYQELFTHLKLPNTNDTKVDTAQKTDLGRKLLAGGPVAPERGFILHQPIGNWDSSLTITDHLALSTSEDILNAMAKHEGPEQARIALGYAGWEAGQLEKELETNSWLYVEANPTMLFETPADQLWDSAANLLGINWSQLSQQEGHA